MVDDRAARRRAFVVDSGWGDATESLLAGDASFRKYFRLRRGDGTRVVMDAPPPEEDVRPFTRIGRHLSALGFSAPEIHAVDDAAGFLLLEDLGDDTYARVLARGLAAGTGGDERGLYALAVDALAALHGRGDTALLPDLTAYAGDALVEAAMLLPEWYLPAAAGREARADELASYRAAWRDTLAAMPAHAETLLLRDFHMDNLLWLPGRPGVRACGLLDFQDAQRGHAAYDLMSLIEDARRDIAPALRDDMLARYEAAAGVADRAAFRAAFAILAAQRHARVVGLFVRLLRRDGKPVYLPHLPRVWRLLDRALEHEACAPLRRWIAAHLPPDARVVRA
ncbi:MAG: phosphotransferase [Rhodospirillales bacterium]|nr:MAG: phosphotransferase [Rhodospirillales bacterium]